MGEEKVIKLVKQRSYFIPADAKSYRLLCDFGMASTRIHEDIIQTVKDVVSKQGYTLRASHFRKVYNEFFDQLQAAWESQPGRNFSLNKDRLILKARQKAYAQARKHALPRAEARLRAFLERWGYVGDFAFSEKAGLSLRLVVDLRKDVNPPVIKMKAQRTEEQRTLVVGRHRLKFSQDPKFFYVEVEAKAGDTWVRKDFFQALHNEVSDPKFLIGSLIDSYSRADNESWNSRKMPANKKG